jgi:hypothetical protein
MAERFDTIHYVPGGLARKTIVRLKRALGYALNWPELKVL